MLSYVGSITGLPPDKQVIELLEMHDIQRGEKFSKAALDEVLKVQKN
ncbi:hypothetical protein HYS31_01550 [Candidatus Woesearchaeota archaeon]|nr:hypothetical protein [Candidatus Woesearchaeota archaeon]